MEVLGNKTFGRTAHPHILQLMSTSTGRTDQYPGLEQFLEHSAAPVLPCRAEYMLQILRCNPKAGALKKLLGSHKPWTQPKPCQYRHYWKQLRIMNFALEGFLQQEVRQLAVPWKKRLVGKNMIIVLSTINKLGSNMQPKNMTNICKDHIPIVIADATCSNTVECGFGTSQDRTSSGATRFLNSKCNCSRR